MRFQRIRKTDIFLIFNVFLVAGVFFLIVLYTLKANVVSWDDSYDVKNSFYVRSDFDPETNKSSRQFSQVNRILKPEEYISFRNAENKFVLISHSFDDTFECRGRCTCLDRNNGEEEVTIRKSFGKRRSIGFVLSKALYFIVSAMSLSMAMAIARQYFKGECQNFAESEQFVCDPNDIVVDLDDCNLVEFYDAEVGKMLTYDCMGHCELNEGLCNEHSIQKAKEINCKSIKIDGEVKVMKRLSMILTRRVAKDVFHDRTLYPFCARFGKFPNPTTEVFPSNSHTKPKEVKNSVQLCDGGSKQNRFYDYTNIDCFRRDWE